MKLKMFTVGARMRTGLVPSELLEQEVNRWLAANPGIAIHKIRHDIASGFWFTTQLIVSIYYEDRKPG